MLSKIADEMNVRLGQYVVGGLREDQLVSHVTTIPVYKWLRQTAPAFLAGAIAVFTCVQSFVRMLL